MFEFARMCLCLCPYHENEIEFVPVVTPVVTKTKGGHWLGLGLGLGVCTGVDEVEFIRFDALRRACLRISAWKAECSAGSCPRADEFRGAGLRCRPGHQLTSAVAGSTTTTTAKANWLQFGQFVTLMLVVLAPVGRWLGLRWECMWITFDTRVGGACFVAAPSLLIAQTTVNTIVRPCHGGHNANLHPHSYY